MEKKLFILELTKTALVDQMKKKIIINQLFSILKMELQMKIKQFYRFRYLKVWNTIEKLYENCYFC